MTLLLSAAVKVTVLVLAALGAMWGLRRRSAAARHWVLAAAFLCGLTVPALEFILPEWTLPISSPTAATSSLTWIGELPASGLMATTSTAEASIATGLADYARTGLLAVWAFGAALGLAVLIAGLFRIRQTASRSARVSGRWRAVADDVSRACGLRRPIRLLLSPHATMLVTWGTLRPSILLPACAKDWSDERMRIVLHHELAHIGRADWVITLAAEVLRCVYWFNPLLWIACRRLRDEGERACDDLVLGSGVTGVDYATHLLAVARESIERPRLWSPAIAIARRSTLEGRVRAMLNVRLNREPLTQLGRAATLVLLVALTLPLAVASLSSDTTSASRTPGSPLEPPVAPAVPAISMPGRTEAQPRVAEARTAEQAGATIEGALFDAFGGLLPGASVRLTHTETGAQVDTVTDSSGSFSFGPASPGTYELITSLPGFATVRNVIMVTAGATVRRQIILPLGTVNETITIVCRAGVDAGAAAPSPTAALPARRATSPAVAAVPAGGTRQGNSQDLPLRIGGQIRAPFKMRDVRPACPAGIPPPTTVVTLVGRIGIDGLLTDLHDESADPQPSFVASAMDAASQWEFGPTLLNGVPVETNIRITMEYRAPR